MALCRWLYRRKRPIFLVLIATSGWIAFLTYIDQPELEENKKIDIISNSLPSNKASESIVRRYYDVKRPLPIPEKDYDDHRLPKSYIYVKSAEQQHNVTTIVTTKIESNLDKILHIGAKIKNKTVEIGKSFKNKTIEVGSRVKNKTLQHLAVLGMIKPKIKIKYLFYPSQWNLTISFEDIGNIMKDTEFLNKLQPLDFNSPILASTQNRTSNYTYNMDYHIGFCDCWERNCLCCARVSNKRLHLNSTMCSNFTFFTKKHELDVVILLDGKVIHKNIISADEPPLLCLGSIPKVADICVHFFNVTFKVNTHGEHKTQLLGCTDFSLNLYNRTIGAHPVDCFQIPGDPNQKHKERHFNFWGNWMP